MNVWKRIVKTAKYDYRWSVFAHNAIAPGLSAASLVIYDIASGLCYAVLALWYLILMPFVSLVRPIFYAILYREKCEKAMAYMDYLKSNKEEKS